MSSSAGSPAPRRRDVLKLLDPFFASPRSVAGASSSPPSTASPPAAAPRDPWRYWSLSSSLPHLLHRRATGGFSRHPRQRRHTVPPPLSAPAARLIGRHLRHRAEHLSLTVGGRHRLPSLPNDPSRVKSTISLAFSRDGRHLASTHGDHTVKVTSCSDGHLVANLVGHPRTPWTVKWHPNKMIVASGCLGFQVRVWNVEQGSCIRMVRLTHAIISIAFHPSGDILGSASSGTLHLWCWERDEEGSRAVVVRHGMPLRCVCFTPDGKRVIVGGAAVRGVGENGEDFSLQLWDFEAEVVQRKAEEGRDGSGMRVGGGGGAGPVGRGERGRLRGTEPLSPARGNEGTGNRSGGREGDEGTNAAVVGSRGGEASMLTPVMCNPRTFIPRAFLYNDGGFDISPDGKYLCACAEYWLPPNVNNAMELSKPPDSDNDSDSSSSDDNNDVTMTTDGVDSNPESASAMVGAIPPGILAATPPRANGLSTPSPSRLSLSPARRPVPALPSSAFSTPRCTTPVRSLTPPPRPRRPILVPSPPRLAAPISNAQHHGYGRWVGPHAQQPFSGPPGAGRFVPHVVVVSLSTASLGDLVQANPLDTNALGVTCVKFSPTAGFCLLGYGVRNDNGNAAAGEEAPHPVARVYRVQGMKHVMTVLSTEDDVNIARFHPESGEGFVYGTKQGRIRVLAPHPWNL